MDKFDLKKYLAEGKLLKEELILPGEFKEDQIDPEMKQDYLEDENKDLLHSFRAPAEGWDEENEDIINIVQDLSTKEYYIEILVSFGDLVEEGPFSTIEQAKEEAQKAMSEIVEDYDDDEY